MAAGIYTWTNQNPANNKPMVEIAIEIWLHSESGPDATILDAEEQGRLIIVDNGGARIQPVIEGFTLQNGSSDFWGGGSAILCSSCDPTIEGNIIVDNWTFYTGGAIMLYESNAIIEATFSPAISW